MTSKPVQVRASLPSELILIPSLGCRPRHPDLILQQATIRSGVMNTTSAWDLETTAGRASQPLLNVCIVFAILETLFVIAFVFSWHYNKSNNSNNTKGVYILILLGYLFCFGGVIMGICKYSMKTRH